MKLYGHGTGLGYGRLPLPTGKQDDQGSNLAFGLKMYVQYVSHIHSDPIPTALDQALTLF